MSGTEIITDVHRNGVNTTSEMTLLVLTFLICINSYTVKLNKPVLISCLRHHLYCSSWEVS